MIIVNISGGLGNQLFQYAFGKYLARRNNQDLYIHNGSFDQDKNRSFKLDHFKTDYLMANIQSVNDYYNTYENLHPLLKKWYRIYLPVRFARYFTDKYEFGYQKRYKRIHKGFLDGYWGGEMYFKEIRDLLLEEFEIKSEFKSEKFLKLQNRIVKNNAVAIHIRRGDYVSNTTFSKIFKQLEVDYYLKAIGEIENKVKDPRFVFFSDDPDWVKSNLTNKVKSSSLVVEDQLDRKDYLEFELMKSCKHFIIANSTFSWWAAWLGAASWSTVVAPKEWYVDDKKQINYMQNSFVPDNWIKM